MLSVNLKGKGKLKQLGILRDFLGNLEEFRGAEGIC